MILDEMLDLLKSAQSLWWFMMHDMSLSKDEREAADRNHWRATAVVAALQAKIERPASD